MAEKETIREFRKELANLSELTTDFEKILKDILEALKNGTILPLCAQPLLQQHLESVNNTSVIKMVEDRLKQMSKREINVLVTGEFNAGKSTFVNVLMGGEYLPMDRGKVTHVVCVIRHCTTRLAIFKFVDEDDDVDIALHENSADTSWEEIRDCIKTKKYKGSKKGKIRIVKRIIIYWPLKIIEDVLEDEPRCEADERSHTQSHFPNEFIDRLNRPHAESFTKHGDVVTQDRHQTFVKQLRTSNDETTPKTIRTSDENVTETKDDKSQNSDGTDIGHKQESGDTNVVIVGSVERASDFLFCSGDSNSVETATEKENTETKRSKEQEYASDDDLDDHDIGIDSRRSIEKKARYTDQTHRKEILQQSSQEGGDDSMLDGAEERTFSRMQDFQFAFLDCPGIDLQDDEPDCAQYIGMIREVKNCQSFIFIIDASRDSGVKKRGVKELMNDIEKEFLQRNMNFNPDLARFLANKTDYILDDKSKADKLKDEVLQKIIEVWPLVRKENVIPFQANKELEHHLSDTERRCWIRQFLLTTIRITLEEHCIWLLRMLEIAHRLAKLGQKASPIITKLEEDLQKTIGTANEIRGLTAEVSDKKARRQARKDLQDILIRNEKELKSIKWEERQIVDKIPNANINWSELVGLAHNLIGEKVEETVPCAVSELKKSYEKKTNDTYCMIEEKLQALQDGIFGLEELKEDDKNLRKGFSTFIAPVAISAGIRVIPYINPLVLMVAPLIPLGLFGKLVIDDIQETINDTKRVKFKDNKVEFMKQETKRILDIANNDLGEGSEKNSPLLNYIIGDPKNKIINDKIDQVINVAELLLKMSCNKNEESQKCSKRFVISTMKFYVEKVMNHEYKHKHDIEWEYNEENIRRPIDQGANACTYEAKLSDRFHYKKPVAVKEIRCKLHPSDNSFDLPTDLDAYRECFYLRQLSAKRHDRFVNFLGTGISISDGFLNLRIVMERYSGDLKRHVLCAPRSPSQYKHCQEYLHYARQCTEGLNFIHENNVIHRDVKATNFLIKKKTDSCDNSAGFCSVVISDVGCAKMEKANCTRGKELGTSVYWAPEISLANTFHSKASDVFSLGLVLWELWTRKLSYDENGRKTTLLKVVKNEEVPFIRQCLKTDPRFRITTGALLNEIIKCQKEFDDEMTKKN